MMKFPLNTRIAWQFLWRLFLLDVLAIIVYLGTLLFLINFFAVSDGESSRDMIVKVVKQTQIKDNDVQVSPARLRQIAEKQSWLQILDPQGKEIYQYHRPKDFPRRYLAGQLVKMKPQEKLGYQLFTWYERRGQQMYTWVYGRPGDTFLLWQLIKHHVQVKAGQIYLDQAGKQRLRKADQWLQIIDETGNEIIQVARPNSIPTQYTPGELAYYAKYAYQKGQLVEVEYQEIAGQRLTWIIGRSLHNPTPIDPHVGLGADQQKWTTFAFLLALFLGLLMVVLFSLLYGKRIGEPILHVINWLHNLAKGNYREPTIKGWPRSKTLPSGELKRTYRLYQEVIESMERLTATLKQNQQEQHHLQRTREEWISGVSHDLKTPLSSVKGYADLLSSADYQWQPAEIRRYAEVIENKARYMETLLNDLSLTFRLKNDALPLHRQQVDLVEVVRRAVIDATNDPRSQDQQLTFTSTEDELFFSLDQQWFHRALLNLLMNAVMHNPAGTQIDISIQQTELSGILIIIKDSGCGMDQETLNHLFDRYYRGTNTTEHSTGTGLGMAIAHQLIKVHNGTIEIESKLGQGTTLTIRLQ